MWQVLSCLMLAEPASLCLATARVPPPWREGNTQVSVINLTLTNFSDHCVDVPYSIRLENTFYGVVRDAWNWRVTGQQAGVITGTVEQGEQVLQPHGNSHANVGVTVECTGSELVPHAIWLNDMPCTVEIVD